jgi:hypothetical protein
MVKFKFIIKMKKIFIIPILLMLFIACNKKEVPELDFSVRTERSNYRVGDTVRFLLSGNPDQVVFYSGLEGNKYIYKDRTQAESDNITLEFNSNRRFGTDAQQPLSIRLLASQKFSGSYLEASIDESADWVDITSAFTFSGSQASQDTYVNSGVVNLLGLTSLGLTIDKTKPIYFAFKFVGNTGSTQRTWRLTKFDIKLTTADSQVLPVTTIGTAGWTSVKFGTSPANWTFTAGTSLLTIAGGNATALNNQVWAITNPINLISVVPDKGTPIKNMTTRADQYSFIYNQPGTYKVTFDAFNINVYGESRSVRDVELTINP